MQSRDGSNEDDCCRSAERPFGAAADPRSAKRTIRVEMGDSMRFKHEMVLGTLEELKEHAEAMKQNPGMAHGEAHMLHVAPGRSGGIGWRFARAGTFYYACLVPGHFEAGMVGEIVVTP